MARKTPEMGLPSSDAGIGILKSSDVALQYTYDYIRRHLRPRSDVLEVGCGKGDLAAKLQQDQHNVLAIDVSEAAITETQSKGVSAQCCNFLDLVSNRSFDALLFTRSLHHIYPIQLAIDHAFEFLKPGGVLIIEDFDYPGMDMDTAQWLYNLAEVLFAAGVIEHSELLQVKGEDPVAYWIGDHHHEPPLNSRTQTVDAISKSFQEITVETSSYLFRYFCRDLATNSKGYEIASKIFQWEAALIDRGEIRPIGFRVTATR